jgi:DNA-binding transcriptional MerR regulator
MPIEELSRRTGVTVRNLRELQTRGLLEAPLLEGRKGLYTRRHLARVTLVRTLQDRGYSLAAIADLLLRWKGSFGALGVMTMEDAVSTPGAPEDHQLGEEEVFALLPELCEDEKLLQQACAVGFLCRDGDEALRAPHAAHIETARILIDLGVPIRVQLADFRILRDEVEAMVRRFRTRFQEHVIAKLELRGMPPEEMDQVADRLTRLRPAVVRGVAIELAAALERGGPLPGAKKARAPSRAPKKKSR